MKPKFVIAIPHSGRPIPCDWHIAMQLLQYPTNTTHFKAWRKGIPTEKARNQMVQQALEMGAEYILFIDDDTQPPSSVILDLLRVLDNSGPEVMACGGIYTTKTDPPEPVVYMGHGQGSYWKWKMGEVFPCWAVGTGCLMVRMELFRMMDRPWFDWIRTQEQLIKYRDLFPYEHVPQSVDISDDIFFFTKLEKMGFKVLAHGGVLPIHWNPDGKAYWLPADTNPTEGVTLNGEKFGWVNEDRIPSKAQ